MPRPEKIRLGEMLVNQKLISQEQLEFALAEQKRTGRKLGRVFFFFCSASTRSAYCCLTSFSPRPARSSGAASPGSNRLPVKRLFSSLSATRAADLRITSRMELQRKYPVDAIEYRPPCSFLPMAREETRKQLGIEKMVFCS